MTKLTSVQVADEDMAKCLTRMEDALKQMFLAGYIRGMCADINNESITDILDWRFGPGTAAKAEVSDYEEDQSHLDWRCRNERTSDDKTESTSSPLGAGDGESDPGSSGSDGLGEAVSPR